MASFDLKHMIRVCVLGGLCVASVASAQVSDDFSAPTLDTGLWTVVDPVGGGSVSQANGHLVISVPGGTDHDLWSGGNQSVRVVQSVADTDLEVEAKFHSVPWDAFQIQGLLFEQDASNYLRVDYYHSGTTLNLFAAGMINNVPFEFGSAALVLSGDLHLKVARVGDDWTVSYLFDGSTWVPMFQFNYPLALVSNGIYGGNVGTPAPAFDVVCDYYFNTSSPVVPEDGGVTDGVPPVVSGVNVLADDTNGSVVFATDEPAYGSVAYGETPGLELGSVAAPGLRFGHAIGLSGLTANTTYYYQVTADDAAGNATLDALRQFTTSPVPNEPPVVTLTAPVGGAVFAQGDPVALAADATDSDGTVVLVEFLSDGQVVGSDNAAPWQFDWTTAPLGNHDLAARATDDQGAVTLSPVVPITVNLPAGLPVAVSDDFSAGAFNDTLWTFVDPLGGGSYVQASGLLTLNVPGGTAHDLWDQGNDALRIVQPVADTDIGLEVKFESTPQSAYQIQGLLVEQDGDDFIRFDYFHDGANLRLFAADLAAGVPTTRLNMTLPASALLWLRLERAGDQWVGHYSQDGTLWTQAVSFNRDIVMNQVGVFAGNAGPAPAFAAVIDYFFDVNAPIDPEDGNVVDATPPVISGVIVSPSVTTANVTFTTDEPAVGRVSWGLTTGLELGTVAGPGLQTNHSLDLTGLIAETTYFYRVEAEDGSTNLAQEPIAQFTTLAVPNDAPTVTLDAPLDGTHYVTGDTIFLAATAGDTDGTVTLVEFLADGQVVGSAAASPYEFAWTGAGVGNYALTARATDDVGGTGLSAVVNVSVDPQPGAPLAQSDDFSGFALDDSLWTLIDPVGDGLAYQSDGVLTLALPGGTDHDLWTGGNESLRVMQDVADADFSFDVKFESVPQLQYQLQGLLLESAPGDYVRVDFFHDGISLHLFAASFVADVPTVEGDAIIAAGGPIWMRAVRSGDSFVISWSADGAVWNAAFGFDHAFVLDSVGVFAGNLGSAAPAFTAVVDYFFDNNAPIIPEDDGLVDIWAPVVSGIVVQPDPDTGTALITCTTSEPATALLSYGLDAGYGTDVPGTTGDGLNFQFALSGLQPDSTYHFSITATDTAANAAASPDQQFLNAEIKPIITVWHGLSQRVGHLGLAQDDFNLMGTIGLWQDLVSLDYSLNGGAFQPLNWGQSGIDYGDGRRLARDGEFNVDVPMADLLPGANVLKVRAWDFRGNADSVSVDVDLQTGSTSLPMNVTWAGLADPQDAGQYVDGNWGPEAGGLRTLSTGYDRIFLLGEVGWQDYEVVCPVTINEVLEPAIGVGGPGLGLLMRFTGHIVGGHRNWPAAQPKWGYQPFGGIGWLRWESGPASPPTIQFYHGDYDVEENFGGAEPAGAGPAPAPPAAEPFGAAPMVTEFGTAAVEVGETVMLKMRCETLPDAGNGDGVTMYSFKTWPAGTLEPATWDYQFVQQSTYALRQGSVGLLAHYVDATFGDVTVVDLSGVAPVEDETPQRFALVGNAPNPFNPATRIAFEVPAAGRARVAIFDVRGSLVATLVDTHLPAGRHEVMWRGVDDAGRKVASGPYFYRLDAGGLTAVRKMMLLK